jgi:hypothetical protein
MVINFTRKHPGYSAVGPIQGAADAVQSSARSRIDCCQARLVALVLLSASGRYRETNPTTHPICAVAVHRMIFLYTRRNVDYWSWLSKRLVIYLSTMIALR